MISTITFLIQMQENKYKMILIRNLITEHGYDYKINTHVELNSFML